VEAFEGLRVRHRRPSVAARSASVLAVRPKQWIRTAARKSQLVSHNQSASIRRGITVCSRAFSRAFRGRPDWGACRPSGSIGCRVPKAQKSSGRSLTGVKTQFFEFSQEADSPRIRMDSIPGLADTTRLRAISSSSPSTRLRSFEYHLQAAARFFRFARAFRSSGRADNADATASAIQRWVPGGR
jgi:hypothetical protein